MLYLSQAHGEELAKLGKNRNKSRKYLKCNYLPSLDRLQSLRCILVKMKSCVSILPKTEPCASGILNEDKFKLLVLLSSPETLEKNRNIFVLFI
jgi:hypothetical protein